MPKQVKRLPAARGARVQVTLTLPPELVTLIDEQAEREDRSRAKLVEIAMREWLVERRRGD